LSLADKLVVPISTAFEAFLLERLKGVQGDFLQGDPSLSPAGFQWKAYTDLPAGFTGVAVGNAKAILEEHEALEWDASLQTAINNETERQMLESQSGEAGV
jgi:hypothetical protein